MFPCTRTSFGFYSGVTTEAGGYSAEPGLLRELRPTEALS
jgi:hypothetical protein